MRIVHFFRSPVGGIFRHVRDLAGQQSADGHEVGIICDSLTGGAYEDRLFEQIRPALKLGLHRMPISRSISPRDLATVIRARRLVSRLKPEIVPGRADHGTFHRQFDLCQPI